MLYRIDSSGLVLFVRLIPKASMDSIVGVESRDGETQHLVIRLRTVPEDGKANKALIKFLGRQWKIPPSYISLKSGMTSRYKQLRFSGYVEELEQKLQLMSNVHSQKYE
ncbi:DUF167 domain-containing protein [Bartonella schoenbuchensis]|uniref:UPF0235 protein B11C_20074 n=2 Tax=Bartonella schoenbuchensis TaxID=165694 RepID=E6YXY6_BARSR|nr:DUF167 domain-containing protein [Bartonella schoenbuchensis]AQX30259.1 hypothetical protein BscR1v2_003090 [Bartonella schoenbuchensis R1]ENN91383.1 hypothetical protein m07a_02570 [Bartonella schoenbuchensis m07a]CBI81797.1 conserved hypothetical protein [Bartonella schoenbuchensis R1]